MNDRIRILVGYDGSLQSKKALKEAITIAMHFSGFIKVVNVPIFFVISGEKNFVLTSKNLLPNCGYSQKHY